MRAVEIFVEGGGDSAEGRAQLRMGMNTFLASLRNLGGSPKTALEGNSLWGGAIPP